LNDPGTNLVALQINGKQTEIFQIIIREDNSYTGFLTELIGVPFVYYPKFFEKGKHQTDYHLGADCVALVVYGKRREGFKVPYVAPEALHKYTYVIGNSDTLNKTKIKEGDILYFGFQTAVIYKDNDPKGILSNNDVILHTYHRSDLPL